MGLGKIRKLIIQYSKDDTSVAISGTLRADFGHCSHVHILPAPCSKPDLTIMHSAKGIRFQVHDNRVSEHFRVVPRPETEDALDPGSVDLKRVINGIAHYYWHLGRQAPSSMDTFVSQISLEMYKLQLNILPNVFSVEPTGENLIRTGRVVLDDLRDNQPEVEAMYGFKITNNTKPATPVYVYFYYFDSSDFSICKPSTI